MEITTCKKMCLTDEKKKIIPSSDLSLELFGLMLDALDVSSAEFCCVFNTSDYSCVCQAWSYGVCMLSMFSELS